MAREVEGMRTFLYQRLVASAEVIAFFAPAAPRVYTRRTVPPGTKYPLIQCFLQAGSDRSVIGSDGRYMTVALWTIKGVSNVTTWAESDTLEKIIDAALKGAEGAVSGVPVWINGIRRVTPLEYEEPPLDGVIYTHRGGVYRAWASAT